MNTAVTLLLCTYNGERTIEKALDHLRSLDIPAGVTIDLVVVDNASKDSTSKIVSESFDRPWPYECKLISEARPGKSYALETGLLASKGQWIVIVDDDNYLEANYLVNFMRANAEHEFEVVGGVSQLPEGATVEPNVKAWIQYLAIGDQGASRAPEIVSAVWGAGMIVKKSELKAFLDCASRKKLGPTGNQLARCEDEELCLFVRLRGGNILAHPDLKLTHDIAPSRLTSSYMLKLVPSIERDRRSLAAYDAILDNQGEFRIGKALRLECYALIRAVWWKVRQPRLFSAEMHLKAQQARVSGLIDALKSFSRDKSSLSTLKEAQIVR